MGRKKIRTFILVLAGMILVAATPLWAQTTTPNMGLTKPRVGSVGWGAAVNANFDKIDTGAFPVINSIRFVDGVKFTTLAAAIADLPAGGGIVIDTTLTAVSVTADPFAGVPGTKHLHVILAPTTYTTTVAWNIPENTWLQGHGPRTTVLKAGASTWVLQSLNDAPGIQQLRISDMTIDGNKGAFAASGGIYLKRVFQLSAIENVFLQDFGSLGGIKWENFDINGGMMSNIELLGDSAGTTGGAGAGDCLTLDATNNMLLNSITCEYAPNGIVVKAQSAPSLVSVFLNKYHSEGISGSSIDLQANVALFHAKGVFMVGGGGANIGLKIASSATLYDFENIEFAGSWGNNIQIGGNNFNPTEKHAYRFNNVTFAQSMGTLTWLGSTMPSDPGAAIEVRSNATNLLRLASNANVEALKTTATTTTMSRASGGDTLALKNLDASGSTYGLQVDVNNSLLVSESGVANRLWLDKTSGNFGVGAQAPALFGVNAKFAVDTNGKVTEYADIATVAGGVPAEFAEVNLTAQGAAIGATALYAVPAAGAGQYRACFNAKVTQAATTSSVLGGTNGFQLVYTDQDDSVVVTTVATHPFNSTTANLALNTTQALYHGCLFVNAKASTNIQYSLGYTSVGTTPMQFNLHIRLEKL